jgi:AraC family transcriptional regulator, arabinose operon regulatory protein
VKKQAFPRSKLAAWRRTSFEILNSDDVAGRRSGPQPPPEWASTLQQLIEISRKPVPAPAWWTPLTAYFGALETRTDPSTYHWDGMKRLGRDDAPLFAFQLTLAGWGHFQLYGERPRQVSPGTAFIALIPSRHRYYLPLASPGWTFAWVSIYHPYLLERMTKLVAETGPLVQVEPSGPLAAIGLRLVRGAIKKDFRDRYEAELALFEFLVACEQSVQQARDSSGEGQRLADAVRARVLSSLPQTLDVRALAAEYGMSRTHFSHYFRARTGLTPAYFTAEVRVHHAARMLLDTRAALKHVAAECGFANANYFCKVFRRFQHMSPASYRRALS